MNGRQFALLLREALSRPEGIFVPGVSSAQSARAMYLAGHRKLYLGGYAGAALHGEPDMGIRTASEVFQHLESISDAVDAILIADIDDGYGGIHNVRRIVRNIFGKTKVAAVHLEDQRYPKRCGHIAGREILPLEEFLGKLHAALDMRDEVDPARVVIARTDALGAVGGGMEEATRRGCAYVKAGADLVWCETKNQGLSIAKGFAEGMKDHMPRFGLAYNCSLSFKYLDFEGEPVATKDLIDLGYRLRFATYPSTVAEIFAVFELGKMFGTEDPFEVLRRLQQKVKGTPAEDIMKFAGVLEKQEIERRYDPGAMERIRKSEGFK